MNSISTQMSYEKMSLLSHKSHDIRMIAAAMKMFLVGRSNLALFW